MARTRFRASDMDIQSDGNTEDLIKESLQVLSDSMSSKSIDGSDLVRTGPIHIEDEHVQGSDTDNNDDSDNNDETKQEEPVRKNSDPFYDFFDSNKHNISGNISVNSNTDAVTRSSDNTGKKEEQKSAAPAIDDDDDDAVVVVPGQVDAAKTEYVRENWDEHSDEKHEQSNENPLINENKVDAYAKDDDSGDDGVNNIDNVDNIDNVPQRVVKQGAAAKPRIIRDNYDTSECVARIANLPNSIMNRITDQFDFSGFDGRKMPGMGVIIAAYVFIKEGYPSDFPISQKISETVDCYKVNHEITNADLQEKIISMNERMDAEFESMRRFLQRDVIRKLSAVEIASLYSIFRDMNFSVNGDVSNPADINFQERGMHEMQKSLERQVINKIENDKEADGREAYAAKNNRNKG